MARRQTYSERIWPDTIEFNSLLDKWQNSGSTILLGFVWEGYDSLWSKYISRLDCNQGDEDLERNITQLLEPEIRDAMNAFEPFYVQHDPFEHETRKPAPASPPQYDIAFVWRENPRIMWPLEAKVLRTDGTISEYKKAITEKFLTCRYAPFSSEGAMLGYLIKGTADRVFKNIEKKIPCKLLKHPDFQKRPHKISKHNRVVPDSKNYPKEFRCHHLILKISRM